MKKYNVLITGAAGFIGSNLAEALLKSEQVNKIRVIDNLSTGYIKNINHLLNDKKFEFIEGDIRDWQMCLNVCREIDLISHQAALGSVPRSIKDPIMSNASNTDGTLNIFTAAKECGVKRIVYASSSSVYGDSPELPKVEERTGKLLSPYAVTKYTNELYADVFSKLYKLEFIGLRYFNVFGPRQDFLGAYSAVIPLLISKMLKNESPVINGDGTQSRDFTYIDNVVQINTIALFTQSTGALNQVYNVAAGRQTSLNDILILLSKICGKRISPIYGPERAGDIKHSLADISKARQLLHYHPSISVEEGLKLTFEWFRNILAQN